jgi:HNH endonuclease
MCPPCDMDTAVAGEQMKCMYCRQDKSNTYFNKEHVMPRCLGHFNGNLTLDCVCAECNQIFGNQLDIVLGRDSYEALLRFQHKLKPLSEIADIRSKNLLLTFNADGPCKGARLTMDVDKEGIVIDLVNQAGLPFHKAGVFFITLDELKSMGASVKPFVDQDDKVRFIYKTDADLKELIGQLERLGMTFTNKDSFDAFDIPHVSSPKVDIFYLQGQKIQRALAKLALNYAASQMGSDFVLQSDFDSIRQFVVDGTRPKNPFFSLSFSEPRDVSASSPAVGTEHHVLTIDWDDSPSRIAVVIELFGGRQYKIVLTANYHGLFRTDLSHGHLFDLKTRVVHLMQKSRIITP